MMMATTTGRDESNRGADGVARHLPWSEPAVPKAGVTGSPRHPARYVGLRPDRAGCREYRQQCQHGTEQQQADLHRDLL